MTHAIDLMVFTLLTLAGVVMAFIGFIDSLLAGLMSSAGIAPNVQAILLAVAAVVLVIYALRAFGRIFAALIIVLLVLLLVHKLVPGIAVPQGHTPDWLHLPALPHNAFVLRAAPGATRAAG